MRECRGGVAHFALANSVIGSCWAMDCTHVHSALGQHSEHKRDAHTKGRLGVLASFTRNCECGFIDCWSKLY